MPAKAIAVDVSVLDVGGISLKNDAPTARFTSESVTAEGQPLDRWGGNPQVTKLKWGLTLDALSTKSGAVRVTNLDFSALSITGTSVIANVESFDLQGSFSLDTGDGPNDVFEYAVVTAKQYSGSMTIKVPTSSVPLMAGLDTGVSSWQGSLTFTINSITTTMPVVINSAEHVATVGSAQVINLTFTAQDPLTGDHPSAPTGTSTLWEKALNAGHTAVAIQYTTKASGGIDYTGNAVFAGFSLSVKNRDVVRNSYTFAGVGAPTIAATA